MLFTPTNSEVQPGVSPTWRFREQDMGLRGHTSPCWLLLVLCLGWSCVINNNISFGLVDNLRIPPFSSIYSLFIGAYIFYFAVSFLSADVTWNIDHSKHPSLGKGFFFFFYYSIFFDVDHFKTLYWIYFNVVSVLCFGFLAVRHVGSQLPNQGSNPLPTA